MAMRKRAVDLTIEELAVLGANAALRAANEAQAAGLVVTGTVDFLEDGQPRSSLADRLPSGVVTIRGTDAGVAPEGGTPGSHPTRRKPAD